MAGSALFLVPALFSLGAPCSGDNVGGEGAPLAGFFLGISAELTKVQDVPGGRIPINYLSDNPSLVVRVVLMDYAFREWTTDTCTLSMENVVETFPFPKSRTLFIEPEQVCHKPGG